MIYVNRGHVPPPPEFLEQAARLQVKVEKFFSIPESERRQQGFPFFEEMPSLHRKALPLLQQLFHGKCAYCESNIVATGSAVDHFRPRAQAANLNREVSPDHYWWLAAEWDNLYLACIQCNRNKRNLFPVHGTRAKPGSRESELSSEKPLLLDPCRDDPEKYLKFQPDGHVEPLNERAKVTIEILGLNRPSLRQMRREQHAQIDHQLGLWMASQHQSRITGDDRVEVGLRDRLLSLAHANAPYAAVARQALGHVLKQLQASVIEQKIPLTRTNKRGHRISQKLGVAAESLRPGWISRVEIENFRGIEELSLSFPPLEEQKRPDDLRLIASPIETGDPDLFREPWLMLIGPNGVGKSSVLRAVALALVDESTRLRLVPDASTLLNRNARGSTGVVRVHFDSGDSVELSFGRRSGKFKHRGSQPHSPLLAYGSTRLLSPVGSRAERPRSVRVENLFDPKKLLGDVEAWLADRKKLPDSAFDLMGRSLKDLLSLRDEDRIIRNNGRLAAELFGAPPIPLHELSDGYQSIVALATHIMVNLSRHGFALEHVAGTVLLDELEVHLHPTWKIRIVRSLRRVFPRVRFITTTHDPLCLRGLEHGEIHHLDRDPDSQKVFAKRLDVPLGLRVDQLLTGQWFGLESTLDADTLALMSQHRQLLAKRQPTTEEKGQLEHLTNELRRRLGTFADTSIDRIALSAAAEFMAASQPLTLEERAKLRKDIRKTLTNKVR